MEEYECTCGNTEEFIGECPVCGRIKVIHIEEGKGAEEAVKKVPSIVTVKQTAPVKKVGEQK